MSAAFAWDATAPVGVPARPARPRLVSVPTGRAVPRPVAAPVRITRVGRLAITLVTIGAVTVLALAMFAGGGSGAATVGDHATTVQSGQTLSEVAAQQLPQLPVRDAVARIQLANNLAGADVHAGQSLVIPVVR